MSNLGQGFNSYALSNTANMHVSKRVSAAIHVRRRTEMRNGDLSPWIKQYCQKPLHAATYICAGNLTVRIRRGTEVVMLAGSKNIDGIFTPADPPQLIVSELWMDGKQIVGDELRTWVARGLEEVKKKHVSTEKALRRLDAKLAAISAEAQVAE